jgi:hypothetical protein
VRPFVAPSEQPTVKVELLKQGITEEALELSHQLLVEMIIVFICRHVNHVEINIQQ